MQDNINEEVYFEEEQQEEMYSDDSLFNITSFGTDLTFREIISMYEDGDLEKPELQRNYVWTQKEASRFIDSILLGLPIPSIFLAKTEDNKRLIVDGYQRIMTVHDFVKGAFSDTKKSFKLSNSEGINKRWRNKTFIELKEDEQRRIKTAQIHAIVFEQREPKNDTGMYQIFERINTSGKVLKAQEIRNCVYQGQYNRLLFELNENEKWRSILNEIHPDKRMYDMELILRFFAFSRIGHHISPAKKQINLTAYLNLHMSDGRNIGPDQYKHLKERFENVIDYTFSVLGEDSFRRWVEESGSFSNKINPVIFEVISVTIDFALQNHNSNAVSAKEDFRDNYISLFSDVDFIEATTIRTTNVENIKKRINIACKKLFGIAYAWKQ